jgi:predicted NAD-dependent protein-ADP-ribosyltransferase YbiA (DUF1768 family)
MELYPAEVERLKRLVEEWYLHDERELEATFTSKVARESTTFLAVAERLESKGFRALPQEDRMNIITPEQIRFTLTGLGSIEQYCREDSLAGIPFDAMIKDRAGVESNLDIKEYDVRVKVRREIKLSATDASVGQLLARWEGQRKAFRIMRRWTYEDAPNGVRFDLSMVRSTPTDQKGQYRWQTSFKQRDITKSMPSYELEVELLRPDALGAKATAEEVADVQAKAIKNLIRGIGEILRGINKHSILIRKSQAAKVLEGYTALTKTDRFRGVAPITMLVENMRKKATKGAPNIRTGYNVTDKADGLRMMGYTDKAGELFMIDMSLNVYRTGLIKSSCEGILVDGEFVTRDRDGTPIQQFLIFDCYHAIGGDDVTKLPFCSQPTGTEEQKREGSRYGHLMAFVDRWNDKDGPQIVPTAGVTQKNKIMVAAKSFIFAAAGDSIFPACARVLDASKMYHTDGLILTPNEKAIPEKSGVKFPEQLKWKPSDENTVDFLVLFDKDLETKQDAVYTGVKGSLGEAGGGATVQYKTLHLYVGSDTDPAYNDPRGTVLFQQPLPGAAQPAGRGRRRLYRPVLFNPTTLPDTMANTCYIELDEGGKVTGEDIVRCESGDPIEDRSIVEMRYDPKAEEGWRWIPMRIRYDKTERYQRGEKTGEIGRTLNKDEAAEGVWESIHDPVTLHMIRTGSEQPSAVELQELGGAVAALAAGEIAKVYYERKGPKNDLMMVRGLRDFHRGYIKEKLLLGTALKEPGRSMVDLACGQGGDLWSWVKYQADFIYGTDIAGNGIRDPHDGAYRRYLNAVMKNGGYENVPKMIFTIGSSAKVLATGEAGATTEEANIMRSVYGQVAPDGPIPRFVELNGAGRLREGADSVAIMFALHYFFENEMSLKNFMRNVSDSLKLGGLFIGCCFDGQKVFDELRAVPEGGTLKGEEKGTEIWRITKKYSAEDFTTGPESLGLPIDVKFISIGTENTEYLMNFELLKKEMEEIGCELLTAEECRALGLTASTELFGDTFAAAARKGEKFPMIPVVRQYSFFNRWFIFKRRRGGALLEAADAEAMVASAEKSPLVAAAGEEAPPERPALAAAAANLRPSFATAAAPAASGKKKYGITELLQFYVDASLADKLKIGDPEATRWLAPSAHFPIKDGKDEYPSLDHYMAAMKYKRASNKPTLATELFSTGGTIHQEFLRREQTLSAGGARALTADQKQELIKGERKMVLEAGEPAAFGKYRATFDKGAWETIKDEVLSTGVTYRWENDARLRKIVEAAKAKGLYLLYYTGPGAGSELGGKRTGDGALDGENKVGNLLMKLAGYRSV